MSEENKELKIGATMADGTVYAGISPDTNKPLYAMSKDFRLVDLTMTFNQAAKLVEILNEVCADDHDDWRLPTAGELEVLCQNKNEGALRGTFNETKPSADWPWTTALYWSSLVHNFDEFEYKYADVQNFRTGEQVLHCTVHKASVRFVRG